MLRLLTRNWWLVVLHGVLAILFGVAAVVWSDITAQVLVVLFGIFVLIRGVATSVGAISYRDLLPRWGLTLLSGLVSIAAGVVAFMWTDITIVALFTVIGLWAIANGIFEIASAIVLRREFEGEWRLALNGVLAILFGTAVIAWPGIGAFTLALLLGGFAIISGITFTTFGLRLRHADKKLAQLGYAA